MEKLRKRIGLENMKTHFEIYDKRGFSFYGFKMKCKIHTFWKTYEVRKSFGDDYTFDLELCNKNTFLGIKSELYGKYRLFVDFLSCAIRKSPLIAELVEVTADYITEIDANAIVLRYLEAQKLKHLYSPSDKNTSDIDMLINFIGIPLPEELKKYDCIVHAIIKENGITIEFRRYAELGLKLSSSSDGFYDIRKLDSSSKILSSEEVREIIDYFKENRESFLDLLSNLVKESNINDLIQRNIRYGDEE